MQQIRSPQDPLLIERCLHIGRDCRVNVKLELIELMIISSNLRTTDCFPVFALAVPTRNLRCDRSVVRLPSFAHQESMIRKKYRSGALTRRGPTGYNFEICFGRRPLTAARYATL